MHPIQLFGCIRDHLVALRNSMQNGPNKCKSLCHEVASEFFATIPPDPLHWTLNSHFGAFYTIWMHSGLFGFLMKLGSKRAELVQLMQKFMPRSRVGIFCNERTRSTPLYPKLIFWCISYSLGAFGIILLPYETRFKSVRTGAINAIVCATKSCRNFSQRTLPIHPIGPQTHIWDRFITLQNLAQNGR